LGGKQHSILVKREEKVLEEKGKKKNFYETPFVAGYDICRGF
jgi:hypothetical protein